MTSTTTTTTAIATTKTTSAAPSSATQKKLARSLRKASGLAGPGIVAASTPNLGALYNAHATRAPQYSLFPSSLARKGSLAALTPSSLAAIPDDTQTYANSVLNPPDRPPLPTASITAGAAAVAAAKLAPNVLGRSTNGKMAPPVTPARQLAAGDLSIGDTVDVPGGMFGTVRFVGSVNGKKGSFAGVELHPEFAIRGKNSGDVDGVSYFTTTVPGAGIFLPVTKAQRRDSPPTSAGSSFQLTPTPGNGGLKAGTQNSTNFTPPTPGLPKFSQSLGPGRAPSPQGKKPRTSLPRPDSPVRRLQMTPAAGRPSMATPAKIPAKFGSQTTPTNSRFAASVSRIGGDPAKKGMRKASIGPRSASALSHSAPFDDDDDSTPTGLQRTKTNGSLGSVSSFNLKMRPASRANDDEIDRLRSQLEDRDRQLRDQAATLAEMESSLAEVETLMDHPDGPRLKRGSLEDKDATQLRAMLREKNEKIAMLTAEFDAHRADFRSTIDTLEMASNETERVYEKRIEELQQEIRDLENRTDDVQVVAQQLKQLEELVQELEEGLEDARRGEAEARGEVEFLRGEVERTRSELRREREKASAAMNGSGGDTSSNRASVSKELEQKEDEIRGLKAIIHSLSRDAVPGGGDSPDKTPTVPRVNSLGKTHRHNESLDARVARERLERELADIKALLDNKSAREEELERENEVLRRGSAAISSAAQKRSSATAQRSSLRDSRDTVILTREPRSPEALKRTGAGAAQPLDPHPESDAYSTATETSTLWCEICETGGHDILTCTNMFGPDGAAKTNGDAKSPPAANNGAKANGGGLKPLTNGADGHRSPSPGAKTPVGPGPAPVRILPNPMEAGAVAGKESGIIDLMRWCALCERDGHESVDCPFEDAF